MTVHKNDNVRIHMRYANETNLIADDNKLMIKINIKTADNILSQNVVYMLMMHIEDTNGEKAIYTIRPLGKDLHISKDWFSNDKLRAYIDKLEKDKPVLDKDAFISMIDDPLEETTVVYDDVYYNTFICYQ